MTTVYKKGDRFTSPSGVITIFAISRGGKYHGRGYRTGFSRNHTTITKFDSLEKYVSEGTWQKV